MEASLLVWHWLAANVSSARRRYEGPTSHPRSGLCLDFTQARYIDGKRLAHPHRIRGMVVARTAGHRMHQHRQSVAVHHQEWDEGGKLAEIETDLKLREKMWPNRSLAPRVHLNRKSLLDHGT